MASVFASSDFLGWFCGFLDLHVKLMEKNNNFRHGFKGPSSSRTILTESYQHKHLDILKPIVKKNKFNVVQTENMINFIHNF